MINNPQVLLKQCLFSELPGVLPYTPIYLILVYEMTHTWDPTPSKGSTQEDFSYGRGGYGLLLTFLSLSSFQDLGRDVER